MNICPKNLNMFRVTNFIKTIKGILRTYQTLIFPAPSHIISPKGVYMGMDGKTILQLAAEMDVSKQAIQKRIAREPLKTMIEPYISIVRGTKYIDASGESLIKIAFGSIDKLIDEPMDKPIDTSMDKSMDGDRQAIDVLISILKNELEAKDKQIEDLTSSVRELTAALENTTSSLKAAQALHAGTMHKQITNGQSDEVQEPVEFIMNQKAPDKKPGLWGRLFKKGR